MKRILLVMVIVLNSLLLFYVIACEAETVTLNPQYDNLVMKMGLDTSAQGTVYQSAYLGVGCNWLCTSFQDFTCFASLVRFDVSPLAGKTISSATLRLVVRNAGVGYLPRNWNIQAIYTSWNPTDVTWNKVAGFEYYTTSKITQPPPASSGGTYDIDVTSIVRAWASGSWINNGLQFGSESYLFPPLCYTSYDGFEFYSLEDPARQWPKLIVTYESAGPVCPTPGTPSTPTPTNGATGILTSPTLSWAPCINTNSYDVYFGTTPNLSSVTANTTGTSYTPATLTNGTTYYWKVVAKNTCGHSTSGIVWSFMVGPPPPPCPPPGIPSNPTPSNGATGISTTSQNLRWTGSADTNDYVVYFGTDPNPPEQIATSNASWVTPPLRTGTTYYWRITARKTCGNLSSGQLWSFTTGCATPSAPSTPTPANGATGISTSPTLNWAPCSNTDSYDIYFGTTRNAPLAVNVTYPIYSMPQLNKKLNINTTYYWRIVAKNTCGSSISGPVWSFTTGVMLCPTPGAPSTPTPANGATGISTSPTLRWAGGVNTGSYDVYLGTSRNTPLVLYQTSNTSYSTPQLRNNTTYYWMVAARNRCANSTFGPVWSFTTGGVPPCPKPGMPSTPTPSNGATGISTTSQNLRWVGGANTNDYIVYFGTDPNPPERTAASSASWATPPLSIGTTYYWRILARNSCGTTSSEPVWNFTTGSTPSPPMITTNTPLPSGTVGAAYSQTLQAAGGNTPYSWSITSGSLPAGLSLNSSTGVISGTPTMANTYNFRVRVTGSNALYSERDFSLTINPATLGISVVFPNGGETWAAGTTQTIRWSYAGNVGTFVKLELLKAGLVNRTITLLASIGSGGNGSYNWTIPSDQSPGTDYRIRVTSTSNSAYTDTSDNNFTIVGPPPPTISVVFPNGGETWAAGTTQTIRWSYVGNVGTFVKVELLKAGVVNRTITLLASIGSGGNGSYNWTIPSDQSPGTDYRIQVTSISNSAYTDTSDNNFTIE